MLRRVTRTDNDAPDMIADFHFIAFAQATISVRQARHALSEIAKALGIVIETALAETRRPVEGKRFLGRFAACVENEIAAAQKINPRHVQIDIPFARQPAGETDMIRVKMRDDDALDRLVHEMCGKDLAPQCLGVIRGDAGIDNEPAVRVFDQPDIDMVELKGDGQAYPKHARPYLDHLTGRGNAAQRIGQGFSIRCGKRYIRHGVTDFCANGLASIRDRRLGASGQIVREKTHSRWGKHQLARAVASSA